MPAEMYKVEPFYEHSSKVELPNVMYTVKSFYEPSASATEMNTSNLDQFSALELRQDKILTKLADLRQTLDQLTGRYQVTQPSSASVTKTVTTSPVKQTSDAKIKSPLGSGIHDIVINADPSCPPLSLFVLFEMLKQKYKVLATSYIHSSVKADKSLCDIIKNGCQVTRGEHDIALSVVWKKVERGPELIVSPAKQSVITGEVNIARYINRLLSPSFDTEDIVMATYWDEWLDVADMSLINGNTKQRTSAVKNLNARFKRNDWIVGPEFSLVDAVMWSALSQSPQAGSAPENVQKWMKRCSALPLFKNVPSI
ncbi:aminoacyl tRNA synthase complex-interacting multifunctional protein 2-like [Mercenaria mercenaria]|uniref:aminoacyl tRNA synthase complex-interacting multifunctional protein 2-like n=1 Tax=Mercenaria mercenaria TaxID=6596 RepID=UPI00234EA535|nr:aminoacyl tRNA synthase complex-interacting multifunctional protein 2-like [Mercenaria mercenaria]